MIEPEPAANPQAQMTEELCTFGPPEERRRYWILKFEDADVGDMHFTSEAEALTAFYRYETAWNCTLFATFALSRPAADRGQIVEALTKAIGAIPASGGGYMQLCPMTLRQHLGSDMLKEIARIASEVILPPRSRTDRGIDDASYGIMDRNLVQHCFRAQRFTLGT